MKTKKCYRCSQDLPLENFSNYKKTKDGKCYECKECHNNRIKQYGKKRNKKAKQSVLHYYSNGTMSCVHCGFSDARALSIDHINGGGTKHRIEVLGANRGGTKFYEWLIRNTYPTGFQVLCMNCQFIKKSENKEDAYHLSA
jgi:hypothetical protein